MAVVANQRLNRTYLYNMERLRKRKFKDKYDIEDLIECVESRPCIWDKTCKQHKDKQLREKAWEEICAILQEDFEAMEPDQKKQIECVLTDKWRNIKDAFSKSLKKKSSETDTKKYVYHENLRFMLKLYQKDGNTSNLAEETKDQAPQIHSGNKVLQKRKAVTYEPIGGGLLKTFTRSPPVQVPDEDESFFASLLPSVRSMNQDEKLEFRMEVLRVIRQIKKKPRPKETTYSIKTDM